MSARRRLADLLWLAALPLVGTGTLVHALDLCLGCDPGRTPALVRVGLGLARVGLQVAHAWLGWWCDVLDAFF